MRASGWNLLPSLTVISRSSAPHRRLLTDVIGCLIIKRIPVTVQNRTMRKGLSGSGVQIRVSLAN